MTCGRFFVLRKRGKSALCIAPWTRMGRKGRVVHCDGAGRCGGTGRPSIRHAASAAPHPTRCARAEFAKRMAQGAKCRVAGWCVSIGWRLISAGCGLIAGPQLVLPTHNSRRGNPATDALSHNIKEAFPWPVTTHIALNRPPPVGTVGAGCPAAWWPPFWRAP